MKSIERWALDEASALLCQAVPPASVLGFTRMLGNTGFDTELGDSADSYSKQLVTKVDAQTIGPCDKDVADMLQVFIIATKLTSLT